MQDTELFLSLAEIAGVFVGFGALIAVRSGGASDPFEVAFVRGVVSMGLLAVVVALAPVTLGRYDLTEHQVLAMSGVVVVVGMLGIFAVNARTPEWATADEGSAVPRWARVVMAAFFVPYILAVFLIPVVIALGLAPDLEAALYFTVVVLILLWDARLLLELVFRQRPAPA